MSSSCLWEQFATFENFQLAWQRTVNVSSRMITDDLGKEVFAYNLEVNLRELLHQVQAEDTLYRPQPDHKVYVPKPSTTLRTMSLMSVPDLIVYQALTNVIADTTYHHLVSHENQCVYGNIYSGPGKRWMLRPWKSQYRYFTERIESLFKSGNKWIAATDIVSFYDTIEHERLITLVQQYCGEDKRFLRLLRECLSKWSAHSRTQSMSRGIPQGSNASDYLANLFLHNIDRKMIVQGYNYVRYVDDVRILSNDRSTVQQGLILFDLELKRAGLVAQVSKTSVHEIANISFEIQKLALEVTEPSEPENPRIYLLADRPTSEQAGLVEEAIQYDSSIEHVLIEHQKLEEAEESTEPLSSKAEHLQRHLIQIFIEAFVLLDDPSRSKQAERSIVFCLNRLQPCIDIVAYVPELLKRLPWRSEYVTRYLALFLNNAEVAAALENFISEHTVYSWHRANSLWALSKVKDAKQTSSICRAWLSEETCDWYSRTVAARILREVPDQHAFLLECLRREQLAAQNVPEETAILRAEIAFSAFQRIKSEKKQLALLHLICSDPSLLVRRLVPYLLQLPECKIQWDDLGHYRRYLAEFGSLVNALGISSDVPTPCYISETLKSIYEVSLVNIELRKLYKDHYRKAVSHLRKSVSSFYEDLGLYIHEFHQFSHLTIIAFYESVLPNEIGLYESNYASLLDRAEFRARVPKGIETWKRLNELRIRVDHPIEKSTRMHSRTITVKEAEDLSKELKVCLQALFDVWLNSFTASPTQVANSTI